MRYLLAMLLAVVVASSAQAASWNARTDRPPFPSEVGNCTGDMRVEGQELRHFLTPQDATLYLHGGLVREVKHCRLEEGSDWSPVMGVTFLWPKATGGDGQWHLVFWNQVESVKWEE